MTARPPRWTAHRLDEPTVPMAEPTGPTPFKLSAVVAATARLRAETATARDFPAAARAVVEAVRAAFPDDTGRPALSLVELVTTRPAEQAGGAGGDAPAARRVLTVDAVAGRARPGPATTVGLSPGAHAVADTSLIAGLIRELGVSPHDVASGAPLHGGPEPVAVFPLGPVLALCGVLADGELFALLLRPGPAVGPESAATLRALASGVRAALLPLDHTPGPHAPADPAAEHLPELERAVTERVAALETALDDLRAEVELVASLQSVGRRLTARLDLDELVQDATDAATRATGAQFGAYFYNLVDEYGESYTLFSLSGAPREAFARFPMPRNTKVFAPTFGGDGIVRSADITADPRYGHNPPFHGMPEGHLPVRSYLAVPVISPSSGEVLGGFFFGHPEPDRFTERHEHLASGIAGYTAIGMDNAHLYQRQRHLATELQRSMMPAVPVAAGFEVVSRYLPAVAGSSVGGDWLDVIELPAGRTAFVVGDVMGRGVTAAAIMGQVRTAIRAYAVLDLPPSQLMRRVNELLGSVPGDQFVTCLYAVHDPAAGSVTYSSAGHLPPIFVTPEGAVRVHTARHGMPLRIGDEFTQYDIAFPTGSSLVLYTDGLVERRTRSARGGIGELADAIGLLPGADRGGLARACDALIGRLTGGTQDDDIAFLFIRERSDAYRTRSLALSADPTIAASARRFVTATLTAWGVAEAIDRATLIATELVTNAVRHSNSPDHLQVRRAADAVIIAVADHDRRIPQRIEPGLDDERHRGLLLVDSYARRWGVRPTPGGKVVWAEVTIGDAA